MSTGRYDIVGSRYINGIYTIKKTDSPLIAWAAFTRSCSHANPSSAIKFSVTKNDVELRKCQTDRHFNLRCDAKDSLRKMLSDNDLTMVSLDGGGTSTNLFINVIAESWDRKVRSTNCDGVIARIQSDWFKMIPYALLFPKNPYASLALSMWSVFQRGFLPLCWQGKHPDGFAWAAALPGWSPAEVPADCRVTPQRRSPPKPKSRAAPPIFAGPDIPPVPAAAWPRAGFASPTLCSAVGALLHRWCVDDAERRLADQIALHAVRVVRPTGRLVIEFQAPGKELWTLTAQKAWTGSLDRLPPSIRPLLRSHNGLRLSAHQDSQLGVECHCFDGTRFAVEWDIWYQGDADDPDDEFAVPPLVPLQTAGGIWLYHPSLRAKDGESAMVEWTHDGDHRDPDPRRVVTILLESMLACIQG